MGYRLLTGATGLLGSYLLCDGLRAGLRLAVLVRPGRFESARQRIENILARREREIGYTLPRPVILEGDISQENLGLRPSDLDWIARHCDAAIHNAASLSFEPGDRQSEPWLSNLEGTRQVLAVCRRTGIRHVHHVSTAYVAGLREGRILESELDVGQTLGNDYERSKSEAEKLVRAAGFLDCLTVYRPAIIVGDSRTGYTTTFHGFYTPLKIIHALVDKIDTEHIDGKPLLSLLGLGGHERKNFVPVDWISAVMVYLITHPEYHGKTYHLTPRHSVPVSLVCEVMEQVLRQYSKEHPNPTALDPEAFADISPVFREQMDVYNAYFRGDPEFDAANTLAAAPHLPCPEVDPSMLARLAEYAIRVNFGWPRPQPLRPDFDVAAHLSRLAEARQEVHNLPAPWACLGLQVNGPGGGQWKLLLENGRPVAAEQGLDDRCTTIFYLNSHTYQQFVKREIAVAQAIHDGRILIEGNGVEPDRLVTALVALTAGPDAVGAAARPLTAFN